MVRSDVFGFCSWRRSPPGNPVRGSAAPFGRSRLSLTPFVSYNQNEVNKPGITDDTGVYDLGGGTLDVTLLELRQGPFDFLDNVNTKRAGMQRLFTRATIVNGRKAGLP